MGRHKYYSAFRVIIDFSFRHYLLNFGEALMKDGISRIINGKLE
jgi:hypothetical protein